MNVPYMCILQYDKDKTSEKIRRELKRVISDPTFTPDQVGQQSKAAMSLCLWVRAMDTYATVYRIVEPKRQALAAAQAALDASNAALAEKQMQLQAIKDKVAALQQQLTDTQKQLAALQFQAELCNKRLGRAGKLTNLLGDELVRWGEGASELGSRLDLLSGDALLAAAVVNYLGPFPGLHRAKLLTRWCGACQQLGIPASQPFSLSSVLSSPVERLEWSCQGLPTDMVSVENGLIITRGIRRPLVIDPQQQCSRWIRVHEAAFGLVTARASDPNLLRLVEGAVRLGTPLLLDELPEGSLPTGLDGLLQQRPAADQRQGGPAMVWVGAVSVECDPNFRLYMVTRLANPTYLPEASTMVNLVNFTITRKSLEEQLLAELVRAERPELEESRDSLITSISADKRQLQQLEGKILRLLREATGNLLDDEILISTLNTSKETSAVVMSRVREAELTELQINEARDAYRHPPTVAAGLWFVVAELVNLHPMYTVSLVAFVAMFQHCIRASPAAATLEARMAGLVTYMYSHVYRMVSRGLMHSHKLAFGFVMAAAEPRERGEVTQLEWDVFVRFSTSSGTPAAAAARRNSINGAQSNPAWCTGALWEAILRIEAALPSQLQGLSGAIVAEASAAGGSKQHAGSDSASRSFLNERHTGSWSSGATWQQLLLHGSVDDFMGLAVRQHTTRAPDHSRSCLLDQLFLTGGVGQQQQQQQGTGTAQQLDVSDNNSGSCSSRVEGPSLFVRLVLIKACREDLLPAAMHHYVSTTLGPSFADPPTAKLSDVFNDSSPTTPLVLTVAQGADATSELAAFAVTQGRAVGQGLQLLSLGQGQGPVAEALVRVAMRNGDWVCLQNCHLAKSWMPQLVKLVEEIEAAAAAEPGRTAATAAAAAMTATQQTSAATAPAAAAAGVQGYFLESPKDQQQQQQQQPLLHGNFRLWLTSSPVDFFPSAVLHKAVRLFVEPPRGLKPRLISVYSSLPQGYLSSCDSCGRGQQWQRLVFAGALLHGLLCERRRFGPLGWNVPYEFSNGDLSCALANMQAVASDMNQDLLQPCNSSNSKQLLPGDEDSSSAAGSRSSNGGRGSSGGSGSSGGRSSNGGSGSSGGRGSSGGSGSSSVWEALLHIVGQINYGGRVTDPEDRLLLGGIMQQHLSPEVLSGSIRLGPPGSEYCPSMPASDDVLSCLQHIHTLQLPNDPVLFGLHPNAAIACNKQEGRRLLEDVLSMQPVSAASAVARATTSRPSTATAAATATGKPSTMAAAATGPASSEVQVADQVKQLLLQLPQVLDRAEASILHDPFAALPCGRMNPMGVVLLQEMARYNTLLQVVLHSLRALQSACAGLSVLDNQGEAALAALSNNQLPASWSAAAYPSSKALGAWMADLLQRVAFIRQWLTTGTPAVFWLPGLFFPEAFLIAVLQSHALQSKGTAIDRLSLAHVVLSAAPGPSSISKPPSVGVYIHGLHLEGARWDASTSCLADPAPGEMSCPLPVIHLVPHEAEGPPTSSTGSSSSSYPGNAAAEAQQVASPAANEAGSRPDGMFRCPVYKTPARAGVLGSSTGQSTNFLMHMQLPIPAHTSPARWWLQGVAVLCSLDE